MKRGSVERLYQLVILGGVCQEVLRRLQFHLGRRTELYPLGEAQPFIGHVLKRARLHRTTCKHEQNCSQEPSHFLSKLFQCVSVLLSMDFSNANASAGMYTSVWH